MAEGRFGQIAGAAGGKVVWTVLPIVGAHGRGGHKEAPGRLEMFDFATLRAETLMEKADAFALAADHVTLRRARGQAAARDRRRPRAGRARRPRRPTSRRARAAGSTSTRIRLSIEPRSEWRQMLREVWRLQRDQFWVPDMSGVDWDAV